MIVTPKGIRRNNPCNVMCTHPRQGWTGAVLDAAFDGDREEAFVTAFWGLRAAGMVLLNDELHRGLWTLREIYNSFAPPVENNTTAYVQNMAAWMAVGPDQRIDLRQPGALARALTACTRQEEGEQPYSADLISEAASAALRGVGISTAT